MATLSTTAQEAKRQVKDLADDEKKVVVAQLNSELFPTDDRSKTIIWIVLLLGLFAVAIVSILVAANLDAKKDATAYVAVTSAVVAGVIGLFAKSPTS